MINLKESSVFQQAKLNFNLNNNPKKKDILI
jgi:hypothetical protein